MKLPPIRPKLIRTAMNFDKISAVIITHSFSLFEGNKKTPFPRNEANMTMAGAVRLELTTYGFGDRCSTS